MNGSNARRMTFIQVVKKEADSIAILKLTVQLSPIVVEDAGTIGEPLVYKVENTRSHWKTSDDLINLIRCVESR